MVEIGKNISNELKKSENVISGNALKSPESVIIQADDLTAVGNSVVVKEVKIEYQSEGGIIIPDSAKQINKYGKVVSIGDKVECNRLTFGQIVAFHPRGGMAFEVEKEVFYALKFDEIYAVVRK